MEESRNPKRRNLKLGIFIFLGLAFFVFAIFYIGGKKNLFTSSVSVNAIFKSVSGLQVGTAVRFSGINVGTVKQIDIVDIDKVRVEMLIEDDVVEFIKKDAEVLIGSEGLVGNKIVMISSGTPNTPSVQEGDYLRGIEPVEIADIIENLDKSTQDVEKISSEIALVLTKLNSGEGTLGQLISNESIYRNLDATVLNFRSGSENINLILGRVDGTVANISRDLSLFTRSINTVGRDLSSITTRLNSEDNLLALLNDTAFANEIKEAINNTNQTTRNLERGTFGFYQNMEALKHNFLFKGYFEDIGYWDKAEFEKELDTREQRIINREKMLEKREQELEEQRKKLEGKPLGD